jgi:hypothetical protein
MGIIEVRRISKGTVSQKNLESIIVFPNPTEGGIEIDFRIKEESPVTVAVNDMIGKEVLRLIDEKMPAGDYKYRASLARLADGMYVLTVTTDSQVMHSKIIVNK